jgi:hypothetical protein
MKILTYHTVRYSRLIMMAVYGRNMGEEGGLIISCIGDVNILYEINNILKQQDN